MWRLNDPQCNEALKIKYEVVQYTRGRGLDIGCGGFKAFPHFIGVDNGHHWGTDGIDVVSEADKLDMFANQSMDFVFTSHVIEHIEDTHKLLKEWWRVIKPSGHLVIYAPHKDLYPNIGEEGANTDHKHDFLPEDIDAFMDEIGAWELVVDEVRDQDYGEGQQGNEYSFLKVYKKHTVNKKLRLVKRDKPKKTCCVVRYGGFGDMIQASSVFPMLKAQGYHVTVMTTPSGKEILLNNPYIDEFFIQDKDQVPNEELGPFWGVQRRKFDRWINLSESVEAGLLVLPDRIGYQYSHEARHAIYNVNYLERTHLIAGVPFKDLGARFYPTEEEISWADGRIEELGGKVLVYALSGSSVHKVWPYMDALVARLLITFPDLTIVMTGDNNDRMLYAGWEKEERVICTAGVWSIRESLTFAQKADLVFGAETGLLNSVGIEDVPKVVLLSHSSHENLTKHWVNAQALTPENTPCYPCHQMHYSFRACTRNEETGVSACQSDISADRVYAAMRDYLNEDQRWRQAEA